MIRHCDRTDDAAGDRRRHPGVPAPTGARRRRRAAVGGRRAAFHGPAPRLAVLPLVPLIAVAAGCGAGDRAAAAPTVRDSAGITIVENPSQGTWTEGEAWTVSAEPAVDIGVLEGAEEYQLYQVRGAVRLSDGRIVVANAGTHELRIYTAAGDFVGASGGEGEGPGEFQELGGVRRLAGDSLLVWDWRLARLSIFGPDGAFGRSVRLESGDAFPPQPAGVLPGGNLIAAAAEVFTAGESESGVHRDSVVYLRYRLDGTLLDTIGRFPGTERYVHVDGNSMSVNALPFGRALRLAVGGDRLYAGGTDRYAIGVYTPSGSLERLIRRAHAPAAVSPADVERRKQERLADIDDENWRRRVERTYADMPIPETFPAFADVAVDATGHLWVEAYRPPGDEQPRWSVFDPDGRLLGTVETPPGLEIYEIGEDHVLGRATDDFDVAHVRLYTLTKPGA